MENCDDFRRRRLSPGLIIPAQRNYCTSSQSRRRMLSMKRTRRVRLDRSRARDNVERKVRILKKLIPNCESVGLERLFSQTADYISALETRVKVMQIMVNLLSGSDDE